jgi:hypothetical protein
VLLEVELSLATASLSDCNGRVTHQAQNQSDEGRNLMVSGLSFLKSWHQQIGQSGLTCSSAIIKSQQDDLSTN